MRPVKDIAGRTFGRLTVGRLAYVRGAAYWQCACACGRSAIVCTDELRSGDTRSCGCLRREATGKRGERHVTHGASVGGKTTREYKSWCAMKTRCNNPNTADYRSYGGRGIKVCERWDGSFTAFMADMGPRPKGKTLDRINVNANYEPLNCRWATNAEQQKNKRKKS
jgi:hypothetical protein